MVLSHFLHSSIFPGDLTFATHSTPIPQGTNDVLRHRAVGVRFYVPSNRVSLSINGCFSRITTDSSFGRAEIQPAFIFDLKNILQSTGPVFYFTRPGAAYRSFFHNYDILPWNLYWETEITAPAPLALSPRHKFWWPRNPNKYKTYARA